MWDAFCIYVPVIFYGDNFLIGVDLIPPAWSPGIESRAIVAGFRIGRLLKIVFDVYLSKAHVTSPDGKFYRLVSAQMSNLSRTPSVSSKGQRPHISVTPPSDDIPKL